jgi:hypothetical protein
MGSEDLDAVFFGEGIDGVGVVACGVGAGDEDAAVEEDDGFGVVEARDGGVGHYGHALVYGLCWVVEYGVVVWGSAEAEAGFAVLSPVEYQVGTVRETGHAGHDTSGRLGRGVSQPRK